MEKKNKEAPPSVTNIVTKAFPPPTQLSGRGGSIYSPPEPIHVPTFPAYYPNVLKLPTHLTMLKLIKRYPNQSQMLEFCRAVVAKLTPCFGEAVAVGELREDLALGSMNDPLESILRCNQDRARGSDIDLERKVQQSDQWSTFVKALGRAADARAQATAQTTQMSTAATHSGGKAKPTVEGKRRGRPPDLEVGKRVRILHAAGIKNPSDLRNAQKLRNAFAALERGGNKIPGFDTTDWMGLLDDPERSEELKSVKESLRLNLIRKKS